MLRGYHLGRLLKSVQPRPLSSASLLNLGASNVGYGCTNSVADRCSQKESQAQFEAFRPHNVPPAVVSIYYSLPRLRLADNCRTAE